MADGTCSKCARKVYARKMCEPHYRAAMKSGEIVRVKLAYDGPCPVAGCDGQQWARGLCQKHYDLQRRRGSENAELLRVRDRICSVGGCGDRATGHGLCALHRRRLARNGDPGEAFPRQIDRECRWCDARFSHKDARRDYCSAECARFGKGVMGARYRYGVTFEEYRTLYRAQVGLCAICRQAERSERNRLLCVDHDHVTGQVRALLCSHCNRAIGLLQDDPKVIEAAARYVRASRQMKLFLA